MCLWVLVAKKMFYIIKFGILLFLGQIFHYNLKIIKICLAFCPGHHDSKGNYVEGFFNRKALLKQMLKRYLTLTFFHKTPYQHDEYVPKNHDF